MRFSSRMAPVALLLVCLIGFGLMATRLGFYWDDWPSIWFLHNFGPSIYTRGFAADRPLLAYVFMLTTSLLGESPIAWQFFAIFSRWLCGLGLWWMLLLLWPKRLRQATWVAFLFVVYPGFRQQYISVTYGNGLLVYSMFLFSFVAMILALRRPRWRWPLGLLSIACCAASLFISEYFFGLELMRPLILWLAQDERRQALKARARRIALQWMPYFLVVVAFLFWRIFLHPTPRGQIIIFDRLRASPLSTLLDMSLTILGDFVEVSLFAWLQPFKITGLLDEGVIVILLYVLVALAATLLTAFFLIRLREDAQAENDLCMVKDRRRAWQFIALGIVALLAAGWPFWVTNLHIELIFPWDRFTMVMMPGVSLLFAGLVDLAGRPARQSAILIGVAVGLAAAMHFRDGVDFRKEWLMQEAFFRQLAWRAPEIEPGTVLLTAELPFTYYSDNSLTAPLNWIYSPDDSSRQMPYALYDLEARYGALLFSLEPGTPVRMPYRATEFTGSTSQALVLFYNPPRCVKVMHPRSDRNLPYKPDLIPDALGLSNPGLITDSSTPAQPPVAIFGPQPAPDWCYYFEKAELAGQIGDWARVVQLGEQAFKLDKKFTRETASELAPFILGYANVGEWSRAAQLSIQAYEASEKMKNMLCASWYSLGQTTPASPERQAAFDQVKDSLQCQFTW
ncbi:MAG: hypothetical protein JXA78_18170 [Anaerolineales bacterium]|nr:hypothetical protein [Anaerolineales bacterium]